MIIRLLFLLLLIASIPISQAANISVPPDITAYLNNDNNSVGEDGMLPFNDSKTGNFIQFVAANWRSIASNFDQVAPSAPQQCLVVAAAETLPPNDYVEFVGQICDLASSGRVAPQAIWTILDAGMNKNGFLAYNYNQPKVSAVIDKLQVITLKENPKQWAEFFKEMKSGQMKQNVIQRLKREGDSMPETLVETKRQITQPNLPLTATAQSHTTFSPAPEASISPGSSGTGAAAAGASKATVWPWFISIAAIAGLTIMLLKSRR